MSRLTALRVRELMVDCLYLPNEVPTGEPPDNAVVVEGIVRRYAFHPERLASHVAEIAALCDELPSQFHKAGGGGWSFLNLCVTKDGEQWGEHPDCECLMTLALGAKIASFPMSRELWGVLPGAMPYIMFDTAQAPA